MSSVSKRLLTASVATAALMLGYASAGAGSFAIREQGAIGQGMSFAGAAAGSAGLASMFWNPATITDNAGWQSSFSVTGVFVDAKETPQIGTSPLLLPLGGSGQIGQAGMVPSSYNSYQFNDQIWLGLSINAPFGLVTKTKRIWAGAIYGQTSKVFSTDITPTIGYKVNEWLSLGAGLQVEYFKTRLTSRSPVNGQSIAIEGNDIGVGFTLGATLKPVDGTEIGIGYRSQVKETLEGSLINFPKIPVFVNIKSKLTLPDQITIGLKQRVTDDLTLSAGFEWTHWSIFKSFPVVITAGPLNGISPTTLGFRYRDGYFASVGASYRYNEALTLRTGLAFERSPISDTVRTVRLPDNDRIWTSIGASYAYNQKLSFDLGYTHIFPKSTSIRISSVANPAFNPLVPLPYVGKVSAGIDVVSVGLNYRWDDPKVAQVAVLPIVRKY